MRNELYQYLERLVLTSPYTITFSGDKFSVINRWLIKSEGAKSSISDNIDPSLSLHGKILQNHELAFISQEELETNWRYYISDNKETHYQTNAPETNFLKDRDKYVYALSNVYCKDYKEAFIFIASFIPLRLFINGQLVYTSSYFYNHTREPNFTTFMFKPGNNIILVERFITTNPDYSLASGLETFHLSFKPCIEVFEESEFFDKELFDIKKKSYTIIPDRGIYPMDEEIGFVVLPLRFREDLKEEIRVSISDARGELVASFNTFTSQKTYLDPGRKAIGTLLIKAESVEDQEKSSYVYIFRGSLTQEMNEMLLKASKRKDCPDFIIDSMKGLLLIPDNTTAFISGTREAIPQYLLKFILEKTARFQLYLDSEESQSKKSVFDIFKNSALIFKNSDIDDGFIAYSIYFPKDYDPGKKYPLAVNIQYGYGMSKYPLTYPIFMQQEWFGDAIIVGICGRGRFNRDYISEAGIIRVIRDILEEYNIDRDRIYGIGGCTGALRTIGLAIRKPDLFAAVASIGGTARLDLEKPEYELLKNLGDMAFYSVFGVEDNVFNCSRALDALTYINKVKSWEYNGFPHTAFFDYLDNSKLLNELINEKRVKFPKRIQYMTKEPIFNKSHWITIQHIDDLTHNAVIRAEIKSKDLIDIEVVNIKDFSILLSSSIMELEESIEINVNNEIKTIDNGKFAKVHITIINGAISIKTSNITEEQFYKEYDSIDINENLMGIKEVYFSKCVIVKGDCYKENAKKGFAKRLFYVLQYPLKERSRNYKYNVLEESNLDLDVLGNSNFIYVIDTRQVSHLQQKVLKDAGLKAYNWGTFYNGSKYEGNYFAVIKSKNPFNKEKVAVFITYNSDEVEEELVKFLNSFDTNPLFYSDAVICNNGKYYSHK